MPPASTHRSMYGPDRCLPTRERLGYSNIPDGLDYAQIASKWLGLFAQYATQGDVARLLSTLITSSFASNLFKGETLLEPDAPNDIAVYWRDAYALTWDLRTFEGTRMIKRFLSAQLPKFTMYNVRLDESRVRVQVERPFPDLLWILLAFKFETSIGLCSGVARLVPVPDATGQNVQWKAFSVFTNLDDLKGFPERVGSLRDRQLGRGKWEKARQEEIKFEGIDPTVLIIGAGHCGLQMAARLKMLGVQHLVIERNQRVGDNWRNRYDALSLHSPVYAVHMPYIPFPPSWPLYTPAKKLANWLESYVDAMDLNVWTSSTVICAKQNETDKTWSVTVRKSDGSDRVFIVKHVIFAAGFLGGEGYIPSISGKEEFKGEILHSNHYQNAKGLIGKKVVVVGAGSAAHDICVECADYGIDVTMYQRSSAYVVSCEKGLTDVLIKHLYSEEAPPTPTVDFLSASMPILVSSGMGSRYTKIVAEVDRDILEGLHKRGFQTNDGYKGCGLFPLLMTRGGGCYIDIGGSQYIIDGKIKVKNGSQIREFFEGGLRFEDGTELQADVVVFCTGLTNASEPLRRIFGDHVADNAIPLWGLTEEGELSGCFRDLGFPGLYGVMGNIGTGRYYSKHLALQIKAVEEGIFIDRYSSHECTV